MTSDTDRFTQMFLRSGPALKWQIHNTQGMVMNMKALAFSATLFAASASASAFCPTPTRTGNPAYDDFAQQQFYACLNQQRSAPQAPAAAPLNSAAGQINFSGLDTNTPAQIGASAASSIAAMRQQQMQREQQQLQNELLRLQIEQMRRQSNQ